MTTSRDGGGGLSILTKVLVGIKYNGTSSKLRTKKNMRVKCMLGIGKECPERKE